MENGCYFSYYIEFTSRAVNSEVFAYHIQNSGVDANLFIDHSQIVQLACLRKRIWGTDKTFERIVTFQD